MTTLNPAAVEQALNIELAAALHVAAQGKLDQAIEASLLIHPAETVVHVALARELRLVRRLADALGSSVDAVLREDVEAECAGDGALFDQLSRLMDLPPDQAVAQAPAAFADLLTTHPTTTKQGEQQ